MASNSTVPVQCQDDPCPSYAVVVSGEISYPLQGCTPDMTGYYRYISRAGGIYADNRNAASLQRRPLPINYFEVTVSAPVPMNTNDYLAGVHIYPRFIDGPHYGWGGNRPQPLERDGPYEEEKKNLCLKGRKKKPGKRRRKRSQYVSH